MILHGEKVRLRAIEWSDLQVLKDLMNDSEIEYYIGGRSFPISNIDQEDWMKSLKSNQETLRCMIETKEEKIAIGTVILSDIDYVNGTAQIHIKLMKEQERKGYGSDAVRTIIQYGFEQQRLLCIYATIIDYNTSSQRLFEKIGFKKEGILRKRIYKNGELHDTFCYSILKEEFHGDRK